MNCVCSRILEWSKFESSKGELRKMCADLKLQDGNKDEMVGNLFSELVNED